MFEVPTAAYCWSFDEHRDSEVPERANNANGIAIVLSPVEKAGPGVGFSQGLRGLFDGTQLKTVMKLCIVCS